MTNNNESAERVIKKNAQAVGGAPTQAPEQTVAHGMAVEARLVQAIAVRKKKERTAGGKSAAELAESILAGGLAQSRSSTDEPSHQYAAMHDEDFLAPTPSGLEFLDAEEPALTLEESSLLDEDEALSELFGGPAQSDPAPVVVESEKKPESEAQPAITTFAAPIQDHNVPMNRNRLKNLLRDISGKS